MVIACGKKKGLGTEKKTFSAKKNHEIFAVAVHLPQTMQYLVISWCCARLLLNPLNLLSGDILPYC